MKTVITHNVLSFAKRVEKYDKSLYQQYCMYRDKDEQAKEDYQDFLQYQYNNYLITSPISKEIQQRAFKKYAEVYPDEAREMLLELNDR